MSAVTGGVAVTIERLRSMGCSSFGRDVAGTAVTNALLALVGGVGGILLARALGPADRGHLVAVVQWPAVLGSVVSCGITQAVTYRIGERPADAQRTVGAGTWMAIASGVVVAIAGIWLGPLIGRRPDVERYLAILFALTPMYIVAGLWSSALQAVDIARYNVTRSVQPVVYFGGLTVLFTLSRLDLGTATTALVVALVASVVVAYWIVHPRFSVWTAPDRSSVVVLYSYGVRAFLGTLPRLVNVRLDLIVLSVLASVSATDLGLYAAAASLTWFVLPLPSAFGTVAFPRLARSDHAQRDLIERRSILGATIVAIVLTVVIGVAGPWLVRLFLGPEYRSAVRPLLLLLPGTACLAVNQVLADVLRGRGRPGEVLRAEGVAAVVTCAVLVGAVATYGIAGAAVVSSAAYALATTLLVRALRRTRSANAVRTNESR